MCSWVHSIGIDESAHFHLPSIGIETNQYVRWSTNLRNGEHQASCGIINGRTGNPKGINITAG